MRWTCRRGRGRQLVVFLQRAQRFGSDRCDRAGTTQCSVKSNRRGTRRSLHGSATVDRASKMRSAQRRQGEEPRGERKTFFSETTLGLYASVCLASAGGGKRSRNSWAHAEQTEDGSSLATSTSAGQLAAVLQPKRQSQSTHRHNERRVSNGGGTSPLQWRTTKHWASRTSAAAELRRRVETGEVRCKVKKRAAQDR